MNVDDLIDSKITKIKSGCFVDQEESWNNFWKNDGLNKILDLARGYETNYFVGGILKPYLNKNTFCELGCGTGMILKRVAKYYKKLTAVDYSEVSLELVDNTLKTAKVNNFELICQDIRDIKNIKPKHDVVFSNGLIEHFKEPSIAIKSHLMYTKHNGIVIIMAPYKYGIKNLWFKLTDNKLLKKFWPWTEQRFFDVDTMQNEVEKIDSNLIAWKKITISHRVENVILILQKR